MNRTKNNIVFKIKTGYRTEFQYDTNNFVDVIKMEYLTEPEYRKYVKEYGFFLFARKFDDKYGKLQIC